MVAVEATITRAPHHDVRRDLVAFYPDAWKDDDFALALRVAFRRRE